MGILKSIGFWIFAVVSVGYFLLAWLQPQLVPQGPWSALLHPGWFMFLVKLAYDRSDTFYKAWHRVIAWAWNTEVNWDAQVRFEGVGESASIDMLTKAVTEHDKSAMVRQIGNHERLIQLAGGTVEIREHAASMGPGGFTDLERSLEESGRRIVIDFRSNRAPYRSARRRFSADVTAMLDRARKLAQPTRDLYTLRVHYEGANPYFGLYVRRLGLSSVVRFNCDFQEKVSGRNQHITVAKDRLEIVADEIPAFRELVVRHLAIA